MLGKITFVEDRAPGYPPRTRANVKGADVTIAFAVNPLSAGERLTKRYCQEENKPFIMIDMNTLSVNLQDMVAVLNSVNATKLNIAGNSLKTFAGTYEQKQIDNLILEVLRWLVRHADLKNKITHIRSGGQSGADEAGAKAGRDLGLETLVYCPRGWRYMDAEGNDIRDELKFIQRFLPTKISDNGDADNKST